MHAMIGVIVGQFVFVSMSHVDDIAWLYISLGGLVVRALYSFTKLQSDDLSFKKGDRLELPEGKMWVRQYTCLSVSHSRFRWFEPLQIA